MDATLKEKAFKALNVAIRERPGPADDLVKLIPIGPSFAEAVVRKGVASDELFWKVATPQLLDFACSIGAKALRNFPLKNAEPYQVITATRYGVLLRSPLKTSAERRNAAESSRAVNEIAWQAAREQRNLSALMWLARNFTILENNVVGLLAVACALGKVKVAQQIYASYQGKVDLPKLIEDGGILLNPFFYSLTEDRYLASEWLASTFDFTNGMREEGGDLLFNQLFILNNTGAVAWLIQKYGPPVSTVFGTGDPDDQAWMLWLMKEHRPVLASFLSRHYNIAPKRDNNAGSIDYRMRRVDWLTKPPPPTKRLSESSAQQR